MDCGSPAPPPEEGYRSPRINMKSSLTEFHEQEALQVTAAVGLSGEDLALALLEQSEDCVKILDVEGSVTYMNCAGLEAMEIGEAKNVLGKIWWDLWPSSSRHRVRSIFEATLDGDRQRFEAECPTMLGSPRRWQVDLKPLMSSNGTVVSILVKSRDVTDR